MTKRQHNSACAARRVTCPILSTGFAHCVLNVGIGAARPACPKPESSAQSLHLKGLASYARPSFYVAVNEIWRF